MEGEGGRWGGWRKMGEKDKGMDGREENKKGRRIEEGDRNQRERSSNLICDLIILQDILVY